MINFQDSLLDSLAVHRVGNKKLEEGFVASKSLYPLEANEIVEVLHQFFVAPFKWQETFQFMHPKDLAMNEMYTYCKAIFEAPTEILQHSVNIAEHLYNKSLHPKIKGGDFFVVFWYNVLYDDEIVNAIGIFKSEHRDLFLKTNLNAESGFDLITDEGINIKSLDKGAIILDSMKEEGYRVFVVDKTSRSSEAQYWCDEFLAIERVHDNDFHTSSYLDLCREYCEEVLAPETNRKEQVDFLNKSIDFFGKKEKVDWNEFQAEVLGIDDSEDEEKMQQATDFQDYKAKFEARNAFEPLNGFDISKPAVARMKRKFKNLIKLDTEIEIKIKPHGEEVDNSFVERGYDEERGMYFYKVFFNDEF